MVPGFEALAALLSVLSRGADGGRVFRILSGKYPEYLAENAVPFRGRERYRPWQAMRGHTALALARGLRPPLHPRRGLPPSGFCSGGLCAERARGVCGGFCYFITNKVTAGASKRTQTELPPENHAHLTQPLRINLTVTCPPVVPRT